MGDSGSPANFSLVESPDNECGRQRPRTLGARHSLLIPKRGGRSKGTAAPMAVPFASPPSIRGQDNDERRLGDSTMTQQPELALVQHQLNGLVSARSMDRLTDDDERRYRELCEMERFLLRRSW
jgi:hypothetical protein